MSMTIGELLEELQMMAEEHGDDVEVRIAYQPSYPLAADLDAVTLVKNEQGVHRKDKIVWLAASTSVGYSENPYAPSQAWDGSEVDLSDNEDEEK